MRTTQRDRMAALGLNINPVNHLLEKSKKEKLLTSVYQGSASNHKRVSSAIFNLYGEEEANKYDPQTNCFTFAGWKQRGYQVKKGEHGIRIMNVIKGQIKTEKDSNNKITVTGGRSFCKSITVFYYLQVQKIGKK